MSSTQSFNNFARSQLGLDEDEDGASPHPRRHRQWWETHTAIIILIILAMLGAFAATGLSAGYGYTILKKLNECCHDIKASLADIIALLVALKNLVNALWAQALSWFNDIVAYFGIVIANEETIIDLLEALPTGAWQCATGYALPGAKCIELTQAMLPLVVPLASSGACYVLQSDLVWSGAAPSYAIDWNGGGGALYGCGHTISTSQASGRVFRVRGNSANLDTFGSIGDVAIYDLKFQGPVEHYRDNSRAMVALTGARLQLFNVKTHNFGTAVLVISATLTETNCNHTQTIDTLSPVRITNYLLGTYTGYAFAVYCQSSICSYTNTHAAVTYGLGVNDTVDYSVIPFLDHWIGFMSDNVDDPISPQYEPSVVTYDQCTIYATEPFWFQRAGRATITNCNAKIAYPYPPTNVSHPPLAGSNGLLFGVYSPANVIVNTLNIDARDFTEWAADSLVVSVYSTRGLIFNNVNIYGQAPITNLVRDFYPLLPRIGMITFSTFENNGISGAEPAQFTKLNVFSGTDDTIGMLIYTEATEPSKNNDCYGARGSIMLDSASFVGGAAGIVVGAQQRHLLSVRDSAFVDMYYGVHVFNTSANIVLKDNDFARTCTGVNIQGGARAIILRSNNFVSNNYDIDDASGAAINVDSLSADTLYVPCNATAPLIWDRSLLAPCGVIPGSFPGTGQQQIREFVQLID